MTHRAALYTVRVRQKYDRSESKEARLLGDIDEEGTYLRDVLERYCNGMESVSADETKVVRSTKTAVDGIDLLVTALHGQNGLAADIVGANGELRLRQTPEDTQLLRCGWMFRLPPAEDTGWLAVHVAHGRGAKGLLERSILEQLRQETEFPGLKLEIVPFVLESTLKAAVDADQIDKVKLVKYEQPGDRAAAATNNWVPAGAVGRLELDISARKSRVIGDLVQRFLRGETAVFNTIVEFAGITFDEAKVEVIVDGARRTFNIEKPDAGHAFTQDLEGLVMENDEPTMDSVFSGLRTALSSVSEFQRVSES